MGVILFGTYSLILVFPANSMSGIGKSPNVYVFPPFAYTYTQ